MSTKSTAFVTGAVILVLVIGGFVIATTKLHAAQAGAAQMTTKATPTPDPYGCSTAQPAIVSGTGTLGAQAIQPRSNSAIAFTEQDVKDYLTAHLSGGKIVFDHVVFLTSVQACIAMRGVTTGLGPQQMVCLAAFHVVYSASRTEYNTVIFDAHTGNNLVYSGGIPSL